MGRETMGTLHFADLAVLGVFGNSLRVAIALELVRINPQAISQA